MTGFFEMLKENNVDFESLKNYLKSEDFLKKAGHVVNDNNKNYRVSKSEIDGDGIFSNNNFKKGDFIGYAKLNKTRTLAGRYTNHSDLNNAKFYFIKGSEDSVLIAEKDIKKDDEILVNYRHHFHNKDYF